VLELMILSAECGARLELEVSGPDREEAVVGLCALVEAQFHQAEENASSTTTRP
jgi:phosphotransferase system HPr-like phosphotransfer protein